MGKSSKSFVLSLSMFGVFIEVRIGNYV